MKKRFVSAFLAVLMVVTMVPTFIVEADAATGVIENARGKDFTDRNALSQKLNELFTMLPYGDYPYFTTYGDKSCNNSECSQCKNTNVLKEHPVLKDSNVVPADKVTSGYSCYGFAQYIFYYLFGKPLGAIGTLAQNTSDNAKRVFQLSNPSEATIKEKLKTALPGDIIQMYGGTNNGPHTVVFLRADTDGVIVFHSNYYGSTYGRNRVTVAKLSYSTFSNTYGQKISLYHSYN